MLEELDLVAWDAIPQPQANRPGEVPSALRALAAASDDTHSREAYHRLLSATGNNHAGTYYPVALEIVPFLGEILTEGPLSARLRCLDVFIDYLASFSPEPGHATVPWIHGSPMSLAAALQSAVARVWGEVEPQVVPAATDTRELELLARLTGLLAEMDERDYVRSLQRERHLYAWCHARYGGVTPEVAAALADDFYRYEPPTEEYRRLVFHDIAWHWAMLHIRGDGYWRAHPELEAASDEYCAEARRLAEPAED